MPMRHNPGFLVFSLGIKLLAALFIAVITVSGLFFLKKTSYSRQRIRLGSVKTDLLCQPCMQAIVYFKGG